MQTNHSAESETLATRRLAGFGGIAFVLALLIQNVIHAAAPRAGASVADVASYYSDHRTLIILTSAFLPVGALSLFAYASALINASQQGGPWARFCGTLGTIGVTLIGALFLVTNVFEIGLAVHASDLASQPTVTSALFDVRNAAFGLNLAAIGIALWGLGLGARRVSLSPRWTTWLIVPGGALLLIGSGLATSIADGSPVIALPLIGFLCWCAWVLATSIALLTSAPAEERSAVSRPEHAPSPTLS